MRQIILADTADHGECAYCRKQTCFSNETAGSKNTFIDSWWEGRDDACFYVNTW